MNLRFIILHPATWFALATMGLVFVVAQLWHAHREAVLYRPEYVLTKDRVQVNAPPRWLNVVMTEMVMEQLGPDRTLLDPNLVAETAEVVDAAPWVYRVERVRKSNAGLEVLVAWREPVAVVEVSSQVLLPVDRQGTVLDPAALASRPVNDWLRISVWWPDPSTAPSTWGTFDDERIRHALEIAREIEDDAKRWGIVRIVSWDRPGVARPTRAFELWTANGRKIVWGSTTNYELPGESTAKEKRRAVQMYLDAYGPISDLPDYQKLDVRSGKPVLISDMRTAAKTPVFQSLK